MDLIEVNASNNFRHPWELSRCDSLLRILRKIGRNIQYADIGAGDLFFAKALSKITTRPVYAVDPYFKNNSSIKNIIFLKDFNEIPQKCLDFLLLMDVLEHVEDERALLSSLTDKLKHSGRILVTVPAFKFLYSHHDCFLRHYRRYDQNDILSLLNTDFEVEECFYFYTSLFFVRFIENILLNLKKKQNISFGAGNWKYNETCIITKIIKYALDVDFKANKYLSKFWIKLPGLSLCIICKKKSV
ncbi:MAG: class I SAM-dependent methyltransferase [Deltaproteobacteria bacterium]|nr:class I SAM-dependent methyltransferase [Deltaproteobacteria bacterium]